MANFKKFLWTLAALPLLVGCSDDSLRGDGDDNDVAGKKDGDAVYMTVQFQPYNGGGSRSFTDGPDSSNDGVEPGTEQENEIKRVLIVLATAESNTYVAHDLVFNGNETGGVVLTPNADNTIYQAKAKIDKTAIHDYYELPEVKKYIADNSETNNPNPSIKVFVYCNPTTKLVNRFNKLAENPSDWTNWTIKLSTAPDADNEEDINALWSASSGFLMSNRDMAVRYLPFAEETWNLFTTANNPFDLSGMNNQNQYNEVDNSKAGGSILVHRMAARLDFRDGSQPLKGEDQPLGNGIKGEAFTYATMVDNEGDVLVKSTIYNMSLVNMLNEEYLLERVCTSTNAANWSVPMSPTASSGYTLLGSELPWFNALGQAASGGNYVVTPNPAQRGSSLTQNFANYYFYPFFVDVTDKESGEIIGSQVAARGNGWSTIPVAEVTANKDGKYPADDNYQGNYNRWRYITENTFAGGAMNQVNSSSTGVVFRTRINAGDKLKERADAGNYYDKLLATTLDDEKNPGPILYYISNSLYCSFEELQYSALMEAGFVTGTAEQLDKEGNPLKITANGVYYNQPLDKSSSLYKIVFGDLGVGEVTFHLQDGTEVTYADYELDEDGSIKMANGKPVLAAQTETSPNYLHELVPHNGLTPNTNSPEWAAFRDAMVIGGSATIYEKYQEQGYGWAYWNYYYYWNRHNDNGQNGVMAPMEFATVRNNVYKLAVINLKRLGHPRIPENDPDDPKPTTKDEESDLYMTVTLQIVPWVVRVNNIEF